MISKSVLEKLEYQKVIQQIEKYCATDVGKEILRSLSPLNSKEKVILSGKRVDTARELIIKSDSIPIEYLPNLHEAISKSKISGAVLSIKQILDILKLAEISRKVYQFIKMNSDEIDPFDELINELFIDKVFEQQISRLFNESGDVKDDASAKLRQIRSEIREKEALLRKVVQKMLKSLSDSYLVQEEYLTMRDGRIVLPVKAEHKRQVKGFIHSESATGQTVYIEPEETLELNNDILSLNFAEKREIERILKEVTEKIGLVSIDLKKSFNAISDIDSIFARAKYAIEIIGSHPSLDESKPFSLIDARHPLLIKRIGINQTIPMKLRLDKERVILITGPNAGGKTVTLKTAGLLICLALSGIPIPAHPDSNIYFFEKVLADIGDSQSIEDDLSTFSSHLTNIKEILEQADDSSLVLLDEIGTGTDPAEGSALAAGILVSLAAKNSKVIATTHHGSLKVLADQLEGFQNASMEFDTKNLKPTYKFNQGLPGSSYAFEVANRIGFDDEFIELSKKYLDPDKTKIEDFLVNLEKRSKDLRDQVNKTELENLRLKSLGNLYQEKIEKLEQQKKEILSDAKEKASNYLKDVNKQIEDSIKKIKESNAQKDVIREEKKKVEEIKKSSMIVFQEKKKVSTEYIFQVGDYAAIKDTSTIGVIDEINLPKNKAAITVGSLRINVKVSDLLPAKKSEQRDIIRNSYSLSAEELNYRLDIRGKRGEESEFEILKFLDNALMAGIDRVEILHGKGTGALKQLVQTILKSYPQVKNYYYAGVEFGGEGITIVEFK